MGLWVCGFGRRFGPSGVLVFLVIDLLKSGLVMEWGVGLYTALAGGSVLFWGAGSCGGERRCGPR